MKDLLNSTAGRVLLALLAIDAFLVGINFLEAPSFLNLDEERNFPTWYSSSKLLGTALAALWCYRLEGRSNAARDGSWVWLALAALFAALSMDETATAHERLAGLLMSGAWGDALRTRLLGGDSTKDAFAWPVLFAPLILALLYFIASALYSRLAHQRTSLILGLAGCIAFLGAVVLEGPAVYDSPPIEAWGDTEIARYTLFVHVEEAAELLGSTLLLIALLVHALRSSSDPAPER